MMINWLAGNYLDPEVNGIPSDNMVYNSGAVPGQFTHGNSALFNYQQEQLFIEDRGFSSPLADFYNLGLRDQRQSIIGHPGLYFDHNCLHFRNTCK